MGVFVLPFHTPLKYSYGLVQSYYLLLARTLIIIRAHIIRTSLHIYFIIIARLEPPKTIISCICYGISLVLLRPVVQIRSQGVYFKFIREVYNIRKCICIRNLGFFVHA